MCTDILLSAVLTPLVHFHSCHLAEAWGHFISTLMAVMVTTSMGSLPLLYIPQTLCYFHYFFFFLRNCYSGNTMGQDQG
jgi:hypothetical protein